MTIPVIVKTALDNLYANNLNISVSIRSALETSLEAAIEAVVPKELKLDSTKPDFETIILRLVQELESDPVWYDILPAGTGQTLLRNIAAGISYLEFAVERALQETFPHSAFSPNSIFALTRMLGIRPQRRIPSSISVRLTRIDTDGIKTVPALTEWEIGDIRFFNREQITFSNFDIQKDVTLYQGSLVNLGAVATGVQFERIEFGSENGLISNDDVYVTVNDVPWKRYITRPFQFGPNEECFFESTLPNTNVEIQFGNKAFGKIPPVGADVSITWAETAGDSVSIPNPGLEVKPVVLLSFAITGVTLGTVQGGDTARPAAFYKAMAPHMRAADSRASRRADYRSTALTYPGVVDALFRGQAELNPGRRNWMNIIGATILTKDAVPWNLAQWNAFVDWMQSNYAIYQCEFLRLDPIPSPIAISADVYCRPSAQLDEIKSEVEKQLVAAFAPRLGALNYSVYRSDITDILEGVDALADTIEYVDNILPVGNTVVGATGWVQVTSVNITPKYTTRGAYVGRLDITPAGGA